MPQFKWITAGSDSCFACTRWSNKVFSKLYDVPELPVHPNCRCRLKVILSPQEKELVKIGDELNRLKAQSSQDVYDLSALTLIPFLFERLLEAARVLLGEVEQSVQTLGIFWDNYQEMR